MIKSQTLKGFRDFLPMEAKKRQYVINTLRKVFEFYGFEPLETPALEYEEILLGKYGDEGDKLMYRFEDNGQRKVALRYDQTVPLARVVAQYGSASSPQGQNFLPMPFKRYQIQNVWRAENTQKGRFREFLQCDIDTVGLNSPLSDAEIIVGIAKGLDSLGFKNYKIIINDRQILSELNAKQIRTIDKLKKIGREKVSAEIGKNVLEKIENAKPSANLENIFASLEALGLSKDKFEFSPTLARGLDYYTGMIFEVEVESYEAGSVAGGGRYDNLIGVFANKQIPAVGASFGFDRLMEAMEEQNLFPQSVNESSTKILVTIFSKELIKKSLDITTTLSSAGVSAELYLDENAKLEKQLKYADKKQIPYVIVIGPDEAKNNTVTLKNLKTREQKTILQSEIPASLEVL